MRRSGVQVPEAAPAKSVAAQRVCALLRSNACARYWCDVRSVALAYALSSVKCPRATAPYALVRPSSSAAGASCAHVCRAPSRLTQGLRLTNRSPESAPRGAVRAVASRTQPRTPSPHAVGQRRRPRWPEPIRRVPPQLSHRRGAGEHSRLHVCIQFGQGVTLISTHWAWSTSLKPGPHGLRFQALVWLRFHAKHVAGVGSVLVMTRIDLPRRAAVQAGEGASCHKGGPHSPSSASIHPLAPGCNAERCVHMIASGSRC
jgi:hypothetical protein